MKDHERTRLAELIEAEKADPDNVWVGYWCANAQGRSAYGHGGTLTAEPGAVQTVAGPLRICCEGGLHATREPHRWPGFRVFVVALLGPRLKGENKCAASRREIVGEVFPEECIDPSLGVRLGVKRLPGANLGGANLSGADLRNADLSGADLRNADL